MSCHWDDQFPGVQFNPEKWAETDTRFDSTFLTCNNLARFWGDGRGDIGFLSSQNKHWDLKGDFDIQVDVIVNSLITNATDDKGAILEIFLNSNDNARVQLVILWDVSYHQHRFLTIWRDTSGATLASSPRNLGVFNAGGGNHSTPFPFKFRMVRTGINVQCYTRINEDANWVNAGAWNWYSGDCFVRLYGYDQSNSQTNSLDITFDNFQVNSGCPTTTSTSSTSSSSSTSSTSSSSTSSTSTSSTSSSTSSTTTITPFKVNTPKRQIIKPVLNIIRGR